MSKNRFTGGKKSVLTPGQKSMFVSGYIFELFSSDVQSWFFCHCLWEKNKKKWLFWHSLCKNHRLFVDSTGIAVGRDGDMRTGHSYHHALFAESKSRRAHTSTRETERCIAVAHTSRGLQDHCTPPSRLTLKLVLRID